MPRHRTRGADGQHRRFRRPNNASIGRERHMAKQRISYVPLEKMDAEDARGNGALPARRDAAAGKLGRPRPRAGVLLVLRRFLEQHLPQRRARPRHQGAVPALRVALGAVRILRQPALGEVDLQRRADRGARAWTCSTSRSRPSYNDRQKAALAYAEAITWHLNTDDAFWDRMHRNFSEPELVELGCMIGLDAGPAELAAAAQHRAPPGAGRHRRVDGARLRGQGQTQGVQVVCGLLGKAEIGRHHARCMTQLLLKLDT